jgi:hypothetical protein
MSRIATGAATMAAALTLMAAPAAAQSMAASDLRTALNTGLAEHVWLAAAATEAANSRAPPPRWTPTAWR